MDQQMMSNKATVRWNGREYSVWIELVTPARAERILATNEDRNRSLRPRRVARYAADMRTGKWRLTGETVRLDEKGSLLNGQHRLKAVILSNVTVAMMFVSGVSSSTMFVQDTGLPKADADWSPMSAAAIRSVKAIARLAAGTQIATSMSPDEQLDVYNTTGPEHIEWAISNSKTIGITRKAPVRAALALLHKINAKRAEQFMNRLREHAFESKSPESALDASLSGLSVRRYDQEVDNSMRAVVAAARDPGKPCSMLKGIGEAERSWLIKAAGLEKIRSMRRQAES